MYMPRLWVQSAGGVQLIDVSLLHGCFSLSFLLSKINKYVCPLVRIKKEGRNREKSKNFCKSSLKRNQL